MKKPNTSSPGPAKGTDKAPAKDVPTSSSNQIPLQALQDFRFPTETGNTNLDALANASNELLTAGNENIESTLAALDREATKTMTSTKTKASKREKAKKFQKRIVLKIRNYIARAKARAAQGKKKLKPSFPPLKVKVDLGNAGPEVSFRKFSFPTKPPSPPYKPPSPFIPTGKYPHGHPLILPGVGPFPHPWGVGPVPPPNP